MMFIVLLVRVCVDLLSKEENVPLYAVDHYHPYLDLVIAHEGFDSVVRKRSSAQ